MENTVSNPCLVESANTNSTNWLQSQKLSPDFLLCLVGPPTFQLCSSIHCTFKLYHPALSGGCWGSWVLFNGSRNDRNINQRTHGSQQEGKSQLTPAYLLLTTMQSVQSSSACTWTSSISCGFSCFTSDREISEIQLRWLV